MLMFMLVRAGVGVQAMLRKDKSSNATLDHPGYVDKGSRAWTFAGFEGRAVHLSYSTNSLPRLFVFCPGFPCLQHLPFSAHVWSTTSTTSA
jgi:hypothetical protein